MTYARVISDMHSAVSRVYVNAYLCVSFSDTYEIYQIISVLYLYVLLADHRICTCRFTEVGIAGAIY